jgi:Ca2+-binding EF-hand superfamily protein
MNINNIQHKLNEGKKLNSKDLFDLFDLDANGNLSRDEFKALTRRLGMMLTKHRLQEIFAAVSRKHQNSTSEINDREFEDALMYLQARSTIMTLEKLVTIPHHLRESLRRCCSAT